jgi:hypothetical protein
MAWLMKSCLPSVVCPDVTPFPNNNRHLFQTVGPRCLLAIYRSCAAITPGGAAAPPYPLHRLSLGIGISPGGGAMAGLIGDIKIEVFFSLPPVPTLNQCRIGPVISPSNQTSAAGP